MFYITNFLFAKLSNISNIGNTSPSLLAFQKQQYKQKNNMQNLLKVNNKAILYTCVKSVQIRSFFLSVFSRIRTEYGEILRISPYSVRMRENTDQKKLRIWTLFTQWRGQWRRSVTYLTTFNKSNSEKKMY